MCLLAQLMRFKILKDSQHGLIKEQSWFNKHIRFSERDFMIN